MDEKLDAYIVIDHRKTYFYEVDQEDFSEFKEHAEKFGEMYYYFDPNQNITFSEFNRDKEDCGWLVAYIDKNNTYRVSRYNETALLRMNIDFLKSLVEDENFITIYKSRMIKEMKG